VFRPTFNKSIIETAHLSNKQPSLPCDSPSGRATLATTRKRFSAWHERDERNHANQFRIIEASGLDPTSPYRLMTQTGINP